MVSDVESISKPWGETNAYDIGVEHGSGILRVQVKSTTVRTGTGYLCHFTPNYHKKQDYTVEQIDLFAALVIPEDVWCIIPSPVLLGPQRKSGIMLFPMVPLKGKSIPRVGLGGAGLQPCGSALRKTVIPTGAGAQRRRSGGTCCSR